MTEKSKVNNWLFSEQLEIFKQRILDPLRKNTVEALEILQNPNYKWESKIQKDKAKARYDEMKSRLDLYNMLYGEASTLIMQHEELVDLLASLYASWYNMVSNKGKQPAEMMSMQRDELQRIFTELYKALEPLKLPIQPPKTKEGQE